MSSINKNTNTNFTNSYTSFQIRKENCLGKRDKSNAGRIDPKAVDICAAINARSEYYTTSSCAGRCFLYRGDGIKSHHHYNPNRSTKNSTFKSSSSTLTTIATTNVDNAQGSSSNDSMNILDEDGIGVASGGHGFFTRYRVNHDIIRNANRYFNLKTLTEDPDGGGDPIRTIGQFNNKARLPTYLSKSRRREQEQDTNNGTSDMNTKEDISASTNTSTIWLRFEPFILHVACRSLKAANVLMSKARPAFKNVGLTSWKQEQSQTKTEHGLQNYTNKYIVAIWGDEGLDMPLSVPNDRHNDESDKSKINFGTFLFSGNEAWLQSLVNERHYRNWAKINRFTEAVREMSMISVDQQALDYEQETIQVDNLNELTDMNVKKIPKRFDVIGDVALVHYPCPNPHETPSHETLQLRQFGQYILKKNKHIKLCVARTESLSTTACCTGSHGLYLLAGPTQRYPRIYPTLSQTLANSDSSASNSHPTLSNPSISITTSTENNNDTVSNTEPSNDFNLLTTHSEYGIKCVISLTHAFFSPRMGPERLRLCQQVARGEHVLILFSGCGMEALQIAGRTEAQSVTAIELNKVAVECANRGKRMLIRNKTVKCPGAAERLHFVQGDVLDLLPQHERRNHYDRILAPRPKEGKSDGNVDDGDSNDHNFSDSGIDKKYSNGKTGGEKFLRALIPLLKEVGGECHWYDFCADWELPTCERTRKALKDICEDMGLGMEVLHVASVGSIAKRQFRICLDFRLTGLLKNE